MDRKRRPSHGSLRSARGRRRATGARRTPASRSGDDNRDGRGDHRLRRRRPRDLHRARSRLVWPSAGRIGSRRSSSRGHRSTWPPRTCRCSSASRGRSRASRTACATGNHAIGDAPSDPPRDGRRDARRRRGVRHDGGRARLVRRDARPVDPQRRPAAASRPFDADRDGFVMGEARGDPRARGASSTPSRAAPSIMRGGRLRPDRRRPPPHRARPERRRSRAR